MLITETTTYFVTELKDGKTARHPLNSITVGGEKEEDLLSRLNNLSIGKRKFPNEFNIKIYEKIIHSIMSGPSQATSINLIKANLISLGVIQYGDEEVKMKDLPSIISSLGLKLCPIETPIYLKFWQHENHFKTVETGSLGGTKSALIPTSPIFYKPERYRVLWGIETCYANNWLQETNYRPFYVKYRPTETVQPFQPLILQV